jgi:hypothetical protein
MVATSSTATASAATSVNVTICAQKSVRLPGEYSGPASGTYENQPVSGPMLSRNATHTMMPPARYTQ